MQSPEPDVPASSASSIVGKADPWRYDSQFTKLTDALWRHLVGFGPPEPFRLGTLFIAHRPSYVKSDSRVPAERTVRVDTRMGTDGSALARCTWTVSVLGDRFEGLLTEPDTIGVVAR